MQLIDIYKEVNGLTATGMELRVIMDDLYSDNPVQGYYCYYTASGIPIEEGNLDLSTVLSEASITALQSALEDAVGGVPETALLRMWQWGGSDYLLTYRMAGQEEDNTILSGSFISSTDADEIKNDAFVALGMEVPLDSESVWAAPFSTMFGSTIWA